MPTKSKRDAMIFNSSSVNFGASLPAFFKYASVYLPSSITVKMVPFALAWQFERALYSRRFQTREQEFRWPRPARLWWPVYLGLGSPAPTCRERERHGGELDS